MLNQIEKTRQAPQPLTDTWTHGGVHCSAVCIPPSPGENWTLKDFYSPESGMTPLGERIDKALSAHGIEGPIYAPTVTAMNAEIGGPENMTLRIPLPNGRDICRNPEKPLDLLAFSLNQLRKRKRTGLLSGGGCGWCVATGGGRAAIGHVSRDGMIDMGIVTNGVRTRQHESDYHAIAKQFDVWGIPREQVRVRNVFFLDPRAFDHPFNHPTFGERNQQLHDYLFGRFGAEVMKPHSGQLSLAALCRVIGDELGFDRVKSTCTLPRIGGFAHTRNPDPFLRAGRNLAFVTVQASK